jgi:hypothetical protein
MELSYHISIRWDYTVEESTKVRISPGTPLVWHGLTDRVAQVRQQNEDE